MRCLLCCWVAAVALLAACGGGGGSSGGAGGNDGPTPNAAELFPMAAGAFWEYTGETGAFSVQVTGQQAAASGTAWVVQATLDGITVQSHYSVDAGAARQLGKLSSDGEMFAKGDYDFLRSPISVGQQWRAYNVLRSTVVNGQVQPGIRLTADIAVMAVEPVQTPAGRFEQAWRVRTTEVRAPEVGGPEAVVTVTSDDWYVRGVGLVRNLTVVSGSGGSASLDHVLSAYRVGTARSDSTAPRVARRTPDAGAAAAAAIVRVEFDEVMDTSLPASRAIGMLGPDNQPVAGNARWADPRTLLFEPTGALSHGVHRVALDATLADRSGNPLSGDGGWSFNIDTAGPVVVSVQPADSAFGVPVGTPVTITFDEALAADGFLPYMWYVVSPSRFTESISGNVVTLTSSQPLPYGYRVTVGLTGGHSDTLGNRGVAGQWQFETETGRFDRPLSLSGNDLFLDRATVADMDADSRPDLLTVVASASDSFYTRLLLWRQSATGTLVAQDLTPPETCVPTQYRVIDANGDGRLDVLVSTLNCGNFWLQQFGNGNFQRHPIGGTLGHAWQALRWAGQGGWVLADTSLTGVRLVQVSAAGQFVTVGEFSPTFQVHRGVMAGDFNGDGLDDLAGTSGDSQDNMTVALHLQQRDGSFGPALTLAGGSLHTTADVNGDGRQDLLWRVLDEQGYPQIKAIRVSADASALIDAPVPPTPETGHREIHYRDLNGDGLPDRILAGAGTDLPFSICLRLANGGCGPEELFGQGVQQLALGDLNGDGRVDVVANGRLWANRTPRSAGTAPQGPAAWRGLPGLVGPALR